MRVTVFQASWLPSVIGTALLLAVATDLQAFPSFQPTNCATSGCHNNPTLLPTPGDGQTLSFGTTGFTLVGESAQKDWTLKNNKPISTGSGSANKGGGFSGSFPTLPGGSAFSAGTPTAIVGNTGFLTPQMSQSHTYTFTPMARGLDSQLLSFTPANGFSGIPPTVTVTLQGQGVAPVLSVSGSQTSAGNVRLGTSGNAAFLSVTNIGDGNLSGVGAASNLQGNVSPAGGAFSSGPASFNLVDSASQLTGFTFTPTDRNQATTAVTVAASNGHSDGSNQAQSLELELTGFGVGPQYSSTVATGGLIDFDSVVNQQTRGLSIVNATPDADLGVLTDLTLLSFLITGQDAGFFSLAGFTPGTVLGKGGNLDLDVLFTNNATAGPRSATLRLLTDEGAMAGQSGAEFSYTLAATAVAAVPEPPMIAMLLAGLGIITLRVGAIRRWLRH